MKRYFPLILTSMLSYSLAFGIEPYTAKAFEHVKKLENFSSLMMENHLKLYAGYVTQTNHLLELLETKELSNTLRSELKRRLGWEMAGMRMHELYFENLGKQPLSHLQFKQALEAQYGSFENWQKDFESTGTMRGIGWAVLYWDLANQRFINAWVQEHDIGQLQGCLPLLVMDVWEHAYLTDYQIDRAQYIQNFMKEVNWDCVTQRWANVLLTSKR
jgi:Fe-Mn family superoxide dismutase